MSQQLVEILTPLILAIISALIAVLVYAVKLGGAAAVVWMKSKASASQQAIIDRVAQEAHAYAERWVETKGQDKFIQALEYTSKELKDRGIDVSAEKLMAAVQTAWFEANKDKN